MACKSCDSGLPVILLDVDGVRVDVSGKPGKPSHAVDDAWWLCVASASREDLIAENERLQGLIPVCAECGETILDNGDIRCSECVVAAFPHAEAPPTICTPELNTEIEAQLAHDAELFEAGRQHGIRHAASSEALRALAAELRALKIIGWTSELVAIADQLEALAGSVASDT